MLMYKHGLLKITLSKSQDKLHINNGSCWITIPESVFILFLKLIELTNDYDRVVFNKLAYKIEILNVGGNFALSYGSSRSVSNVLVRSEQCSAILLNAGNILTRIQNFRERKVLTHNIATVESNEVEFKSNKLTDA